MIDGLSIEYAHARIGARLSARPDERLWPRLRAARGLPALLDAVRESNAAAYVSGIALPGDLDGIELAFRTHLRSRIAELARWAPDRWRASVLWTQTLVDLPALLHLLGDEPPPAWIGADPELAGYAAAPAAARIDALRAGPHAPIVVALQRAREAPQPAAASSLRRTVQATAARTHDALQAWLGEWQRRWPAVGWPGADEAGALRALTRELRAHLDRFARASPEDAHPARESLQQRMQALLRRRPAEPVALFAYLVLVALDVERLRGEFVLRAAAAELGQ
jgi:hypothetical protein